ncbi:ferric enterobactin transport system permease fepG [Escherichia coli]|nr:ferric enterobactin transport system permease fepG [Escherichia coli]
MIYVSRRLIITCLLLLIACVMAGVWGLRSGAVTLETSQVFAALMGDTPRSMTMVVTEWRLPRVLMALLIGAALGVSGAIFQSLMRNPLGSPDVMGFNTGAWSGVLVAIGAVWSGPDGYRAGSNGGRHCHFAAGLAARLA